MAVAGPFTVRVRVQAVNPSHIVGCLMVASVDTCHILHAAWLKQDGILTFN
jgi:hypothetical protein